MSKHILWIHIKKARKIFRDTLYLREHGRLKLKGILNVIFYTGKYKTLKEVKKARPGIIKRLMEYED